MLTRLQATNYRSLVDVDLQLPSLCLLAGANGSGKSSVWEILAGLQDIVWRGHSVDAAFPATTVAAWRPTVERGQRFELGVRGALGDYTYEIEIVRNRRDEAVIASERVRSGDEVLYDARGGKVRLYGDQPIKTPRTEFDMRGERSFLPVLEARDDNRRLQDVRDTIAALWLVRTNPLAMDPTSRREELWLERDGSNFASWYRNMVQQRPAAGIRLSSWLRTLLPGFVQLRFEGASGVRDLVVTFDRPGPHELRFDLLSDGQRALVLMHAVLAFLVPEAPSKPSGRIPTIVWDEPDNFVSLGEIQPWLIKLSDLVAEREAQAVVISHHPEVIDYLAADTVLWFSRAAGGAASVFPLSVDRESGLRASEWIARGLMDMPSAANG